MPDTTRTTTDFTLEDARISLNLESPVLTTYGTATVFSIHCARDDESDLLVAAKIEDPFCVKLPPPHDMGPPECIQGNTLLYTHQNGWEMDTDYVSRHEAMGIEAPDVMALPAAERDVLLQVRKNFWAKSVTFIDSQRRGWMDINLFEAKPEGMHGRDFVKRIKALEAAGLYVSYSGNYYVTGSHRRYNPPDGRLRVTD